MAKGDAAGVPDFTDREAAEAWLRTQPRDVCVAIAARAALRMLPMLAMALEQNETKVSDAALSSLRAVLVAWFAAGVRSQAGDAKVLGASTSASAAAASSRVARAATGAASKSVSSCASAAAAVYASADICTRAALISLGFNNYFHLFEIEVSFSAHTTAAAYEDAALILLHGAADPLANLPLWSKSDPEWALYAWQALKTYLLAADEGWEVWTDWYEARLRGDPFDPDLELARVLIDDAIWRQGPKAVNAEIAQLIAEHRAKAHNELMVRIADLEATIAALKHEGSKRGPDVPPGLGHNNPPEAIDEVAEELQHNLEVLKAQPPTPNDPAAAIAAVTGLKTTLSRLTSFTGEKLDLFITEASKEGGRKFGAWAVRLAALGVGEWALDLSVKLAQALDAAIIWVRSLGVPI